VSGGVRFLDCQQGDEAGMIKPAMSTVKEIESAISKLAPAEVHRVADWLQEYRDELWDRQIEADAAAGKLDKLIRHAKADYRAGRATPFP
jgi:hypothetical protein